MSEIKQDILRAWLHQIVRDHNDICHQYNVELSTPVIQLADAAGYWGKWTSSHRMINISTRLISTQPWDVVLDVLKHEMAHQLVSEQLDDSSGHGDTFQEACSMLGVPNSYRRAGSDLPGHSPRDRKQNGTGRIITKLRKLMALADSANEHESLIAIRKARQLMDRHNLSDWTPENRSGYTNTLVNLRRKRLANYHKSICAILTGNFNVQIILIPLYDAQDLTTYKCIDILGRREHVRVAEYVFHFLLSRLPILWKNHHGNSSGSLTEKNSYWLGVLNGFHEGLEKNHHDRESRVNKRNDCPSTLPACNNDLALSEFVVKRYPKLRNSRSRPARIVLNRFEAGRRDGHSLRVAEGIESNHPLPKRLPPGTRQ